MKKESLSSKLSYGTLYLVSGATAALCINIFTMALVARKLGVENYGLYSAIIAFVGLFEFITNLGVNRALLKEGSTNIEKAGVAFGNALFLKAVIMFPFLLLVCTCGYYSGYRDDTLLILFIFSINLFLDSFGSVYVCIRRIFGHFGIISLARAMSNIMTFIFAYAAFKFDVSVIALALSMMCLSIISFLIATINSILLLKPSLNLKDIPELVKDSMIFSLNEFFTRLYTRAPIVILTIFTPLKIIGIFGIAIRFTRFATIIPRQIRGAALPTIYAILDDGQKTKGTKEELVTNNERSKRVFKTLLKYISLVSAPSIVIIYQFSEPIINLIVGPKYDSSIPLIQLLSFFIFFRFIQTPYTLFLIALNKHKNLVLMQAITSVILVGICFLLIPSYSNDGACYALIISEFLLVVIMIVYGLQYEIWNIKDSLIFIISPLVASAISVLLMIMTFNHMNMILKLIAFSVYYIIFLVITKQLKKQDFELIKKIALKR